MELTRDIKHLYRFLNEFFENRHAISVGIVFLFFLLNISGIMRKIIIECIYLLLVDVFLNCTLSLLNYKSDCNVLLMYIECY